MTSIWSSSRQNSNEWDMHSTEVELPRTNCKLKFHKTKNVWHEKPTQVSKPQVSNKWSLQKLKSNEQHNEEHLEAKLKPMTSQQMNLPKTKEISWNLGVKDNESQTEAEARKTVSQNMLKSLKLPKSSKAGRWSLEDQLTKNFQVRNFQIGKRPSTTPPPPDQRRVPHRHIGQAQWCISLSLSLSLSLCLSVCLSFYLSIWKIKNEETLRDFRNVWT